MGCRCGRGFGRGWLSCALAIGCNAIETRDDAGPVLAFEEIAVDESLFAITDLAFVPGREELLVLDKGGRVTHLRLGEHGAQVLGAFEVPQVHSELDCGLISLAFDPAWSDNGFVYFATCIDATQGSILRLQLDLDDLRRAPATAVEILRAGDILADRPWHNLGALGFDAAGVMWALVGDKNVRANGQSADDVLGAVVRIVPSRAPDRGGYVPAPDNPWNDARARDPAVVAIGLRSPWRGALDSRGRLWLGDVGSDAFEEIDVLDHLGANFGWALHEGPCAAEPCETDDPVAWWSHHDPSPYVDDDPHAIASDDRAAWVGLEHRPPPDDPYDGALAGRMLFGDFCVGFVRALALDDRRAIIGDEPIGHLANASAWAQGPGGWIYASTFGSCETDEGTDLQPPRGRLWRAVPSR